MEFDSPAFWWVNQNQTYGQERHGGYMWSPKKNKNGAKNNFYDNMTRVNPGDIVFSFKGTRIPSMGIITSKGYPAPKPREFGETGSNWGQIGWKVDVRYFDLGNVIRPKNFIDELRPTLPSKYSPLTASGDGLQSVYLASIPLAMSKILLDKIGREASRILNSAADLILSEEELQEAEEERIEEEIQQNKQIDVTEKKAVIKARRGQGLFRQNLEAIESRCRVTGVTNPNHLIASHMKPWAKCSNNAERLDGHNGLLLAPNIDHLFDKGYISFKNDGGLIISPLADLQALTQMGVPVGRPLNVGHFREQQKAYLEYHRKVVLKK